MQMDTNSQEKSNEPLYQPLPSGLSSGNVPNVFESDASRVHLRRHVASLLPSTVVADNIYDEKVKAKALMLALNKSYVVLSFPSAFILPVYVCYGTFYFSSIFHLQY